MPPITSAHQSTTSNGRLRALQIGRGIAALLVVLYHLNNSVWDIDKYFAQPFSPVLSFGNSGVQFFFVLSGFIIFLIHAKDIGPREGARERLRAFANKRFIRVYPTYWIVLAAFIVTLYLEPFLGSADERRIGNFIASVMLIPAPIEPILSVAWTLKHEVMFYAVFALAIIRPRAGIALFAIWQVACLCNTLFGSSDFPYGVVLSANNLLFSFGMLAAFAFRSIKVSSPGMIAVAAAAIFVATGLHQVFASSPFPTNAYVLAYGAASAVAIFGAGVYEKQHGLRMPQFFDAIGDASYSIYLIHLPLLSVLAKLLFASGLAAVLPEWLSLLALLCAVVTTGVAFSRLVEMPLIAMLGRLGRDRRGRQTVKV